jgi:hypothetical protein
MPSRAVNTPWEAAGLRSRPWTVINANKTQERSGLPQPIECPPLKTLKGWHRVRVSARGCEGIGLEPRLQTLPPL